MILDFIISISLTVSALVPLIIPTEIQILRAMSWQLETSDIYFMHVYQYYDM